MGLFCPPFGCSNFASLTAFPNTIAAFVSFSASRSLMSPEH